MLKTFILYLDMVCFNVLLNMEVNSALLLVALAGTRSIKKSFKKVSLKSWGEKVMFESNNVFHKVIYCLCILIQPRSVSDFFFLRVIGLFALEYLLICKINSY